MRMLIWNFNEKIIILKPKSIIISLFFPIWVSQFFCTVKNQNKSIIIFAPPYCKSRQIAAKHNFLDVFGTEKNSRQAYYEPMNIGLALWGGLSSLAGSDATLLLCSSLRLPAQNERGSELTNSS